MLMWSLRQGAGGQVFFGLIVLDPMSRLFRWLVLGVLAIVVLLIAGSTDVERTWSGEYLGITLCIGVGLMLMAESQHLLMMYLSIELVSMSSYVLVALVRDIRSSEAALKYILFGALCSGIMLFGLSWVFGLTGELGFASIRSSVSSLTQARAAALAISVALVLAGLAFKISMVPFHMWTPDVYEGAPLPVAALLSVGPKAAGLALLLRLTDAFGPVWNTLGPVMLALTIVTMTFGNLVAVVQQNVKRLLAYSTIGQVGYLLIGFSVHTSLGVGAMLLYLVAYLCMNLGVFAGVTAVCNATHQESLEAFRGLARRAPALAACLALFLLSLAGIPPLIGFVGKFLLFGSAIQSQQVVLAVAAVVNSAIALYYYANIIRLMYFTAPEQASPVGCAAPLRLALGLCGLATVWLGLFPGLLIDWLRMASFATTL